MLLTAFHSACPERRVQARRIEEWGKLLSDVPAASAILDRLLHHAGRLTKGK